MTTLKKVPVGSIADEKVVITGTDGDELMQGTQRVSRLIEVIGTPNDNDVITFDSALGQYQPEAASGGGGLNLTLGTEVATTSGGTFSFLSLPSGIVKMEFLFDECGTDSTTLPIIIELGDSGGFEVAGYTSFATRIPQATPAATQNTSSWIAIPTRSGSVTLGTGILTMVLSNTSDKWIMAGLTTVSGTAYTVAGRKTLDTELTQIRIRTTAGAFNNGTFNIAYYI